jgi:hypothetical protein
MNPLLVLVSIWIVFALIFAALVWFAPVGYEDDRGFHYSKMKQPIPERAETDALRKTIKNVHAKEEEIARYREALRQIVALSRAEPRKADAPSNSAKALVTVEEIATEALSD